MTFASVLQNKPNLHQEIGISEIEIGELGDFVDHLRQGSDHGPGTQPQTPYQLELTLAWQLDHYFRKPM